MGESDYTVRGNFALFGAVNTVTLPADTRRVGLYVTTRGVSVPKQLTVVGAPSGTVAIWVWDTTPAILTYRDWGPLVGMSWTMTLGSPGENAFFIELLKIT